MVLQKYTYTRQKKIFKKHAKTFSFAAMFLGKSIMKKILPLYEFCRVIDDIADESQDLESAKRQLINIKADIENGQSKDAYIIEFITFMNQNKLEKKYVLDLLDGVISDCESSIRVQSEEDLLNYCYHVAGTVGSLMCPLLGVKKTHQNDARIAAINLGVAMQLTNIARDIKEDAEYDRLYIPKSWLDIKNAKALINKPKTEADDARNACKKLLETADYYYEQAKIGYAYLPFRARLTILIAGDLYSAIGEKIEGVEYQYWHGRQYLSKLEKIIKMITSIGTMTHLSFWFIRKKRDVNVKRTA